MARTFIYSTAAALLVAWGLVAPSGLHAQGTGPVPLVEEAAPVDFGLVVPSAQPGTIAVTPSGTQLCSPGLTCLGGQRLGVIYVTGRKDQLVTILIGSAVLSNGEATLQAQFRSSEPYLILRPGQRKNQFAVSGTLAIDPGQPAGAYVGTYDIIAEYQ